MAALQFLTYFRLKGGPVLKKPTATEIRASLERQLRDKGADVPHFQDLLDDYMYLHTQLKKLEANVRKNGTTVKAVSAAGKEYDKENPALKMAAQYAKEKRQLLQALGLTTDNCRPPDDANGDL